ncbi:MAG: putative 2OG-Fe(II) oxygenase [Erythrobacter sp.]
MNRTQARQRIAAFPKDDIDAAFSAGVDLLRADHAELLLPAGRTLARRFPQDARSHQLLGLAARAAQDSAQALESFARAHELAPGDALIANSHARAALEAGRPAVALFERAIALAPQDGTLRLGHAASLLHEGRTDDAVALLDALTAANPMWADGHRDAAHIRGQLGLDPCASISAALRQHPRSPDLHLLLAGTKLEALDFQGAREVLEDARKRIGTSPQLAVLTAHAASESGDLDGADALFASFDAAVGVNDASLLARHLLRAGREIAVAPLLEPLVAKDFNHLLWPYLSLAWRLTGDPRWHWLEGDEHLVGVFDLADQIGDLTELADHIRSLHFAKQQPLDQSVRGGTQTDGNLLLRTNPAIRNLRRVILEAVEKHVAQLPAFEASHPTLLAERDPLRIAGSWSVRLTDAGFHSDHVHGRGWISSAFYLALPDTLGSGHGAAGPANAGWLSIGESRDILPQLEPVRLIEPKAGRLVLFPSTMWHGTRPFPSGERMTVAFDIARPLQ